MHVFNLVFYSEMQNNYQGYKCQQTLIDTSITSKSRVKILDKIKFLPRNIQISYVSASNLPSTLKNL